MANSFKVENYRSPRSLSLIVISLLTVQLACNLLYLIPSLIQIAGADVPLDEADSEVTVGLLLTGLVGIVEILTFIATVVVFLMWLHTAYSNLSPLKAHGLQFTPGWAVGWWFIPFANLVKPYQALTEVWRESDPDYDPTLGYFRSSVKNSWQFPIWWGSWILGSIFSRFAEKASSGGDVISQAFWYLLFLSAAFSAVSAALAIWIVRDITRRQEHRSKIIGLPFAGYEPPPPPVFVQQN